MKFENSDTLQCLINAFAGESMARNRYDLYAKIARNEGYEIISNVFLETAENEKEHAKLFYKHIPNGIFIPKGSYPFFIADTAANLMSSYQGEKDEWESVYKDSSQIAKSEGFYEISALFLNVSNIEKRHSYRFLKLAEDLKNDNLYKKSENTQWICLKCGHTHIGREAPCKCPVCGHEQGYFQVFTDKY